MKRARKKLAGKVQKVIKSPHPAVPEKAEISIEQADHLYREIRIENRLTDEQGKEAQLTVGGDVEVHIEADQNAAKPKTPAPEQQAFSIYSFIRPRRRKG